MRLFISIFFLAGCLLFASSIYAVFRTWQAESWQPASGTMLKVECRSMGGGTRGSAYRHVHYRYTVDGRQYESEREYFGAYTAVHGSCLGNYRDGASIVAYYDPAKPSEAVLKRGSYREPRDSALLGMAFMGVAVLFYWLAARDQRRKAARQGSGTAG